MWTLSFTQPRIYGASLPDQATSWKQYRLNIASVLDVMKMLRR